MMKHSLLLFLAGLALFPRSALAGDLTIGFIYVGPKDDYGYNQAHALGAASVSKLPGRQDGRGGQCPRDSRG